MRHSIHHAFDRTTKAAFSNFCGGGAFAAAALFLGFDSLPVFSKNYIIMTRICQPLVLKRCCVMLMDILDHYIWRGTGTGISPQFSRNGRIYPQNHDFETQPPYCQDGGVQ